MHSIVQVLEFLFESFSISLLSRDNLDETGATIWVRRGGRVK